MTLGERIKLVRDQRGWNQQELARRAHVRPALLSELESGRKIDTTGSVLRRLAHTLGVTVDYLVGMYNGTMDPNVCPGERTSRASYPSPPVTTLQKEHGYAKYTSPVT
jgi:transcriptional regulator with XRE-family HTH domain